LGEDLGSISRARKTKSSGEKFYLERGKGSYLKSPLNVYSWKKKKIMLVSSLKGRCHPNVEWKGVETERASRKGAQKYDCWKRSLRCAESPEEGRGLTTEAGSL